MKKFLALVLLFSMLLGGCGTEVPLYNETSSTPPPTEAQDTTERLKVELASTPVNDHAIGTHVPPDDGVLRPERVGFTNADGFYTLSKGLRSYDFGMERHVAVCEKEHCPHMDSNCNAWIDPLGEELNLNHTRFAVRDKLCYLLMSEELQPNHAEEKNLSFQVLDTTTGEQTNYLTVEKEGYCIVYCDALISEAVAVISYESRPLPIDRPKYDPGDTKWITMVMVDLATGEVTTLLEREISIAMAYDLWGLTDTHFLAMLHRVGGMSDPYGMKLGKEGLDTYSYDDYVRNLHSYALLEFPLEEHAQWSDQLGANDLLETLQLFSYDSFYNGSLYYVRGDNVWVYDGEEARALFCCGEIKDLFAMDGKVFYELPDGNLCYYDLGYEETAYAPKADLTLMDETAGRFLVMQNGTLHWIFKDDYYQERWDTLHVIG